MRIKILPSPYTPAQIVEYLDRIGYSPLPTEDSLSSFEPSLENLTKIVYRHIIAVPFDNCLMHYSKEGMIDLSYEGLFKRVVREGKTRGYGSYCYGTNTLLLGMLRGLSFGVYGGNTRTNIHELNEAPFFLYHTHMLLFVSVSDSDTIYVVDCGAGASAGTSGLTKPIALIEGTVIEGSAPPEQHRLSQGYALPTSALPPQANEWVLESRCGTEEWRIRYQFTTTEMFHEDFVGQSFDTCVRNATLVSDAVIVHKFYEEDLGSGVKGLGRYTLYGAHVVKAIGTHKEDIAELKTEEERLEMLKKYFGIIIDKEDIQYIKGRRSALPG